MTPESLARAEAIRKAANRHFAGNRRTAETEAYVQSFEQAQELVKRRDVFDLSKESNKDHDRYGSTESVCGRERESSKQVCKAWSAMAAQRPQNRRAAAARRPA